MLPKDLVWTTVASATVLELQGKTLIRHAGHEIAVFRVEDHLYALADSCPHAGASLCVGRVDAGHVKCPAHGLRFRLIDGRLAGTPSGSEGPSFGVRTYPVRIEGQDLQIAFAG